MSECRHNNYRVAYFGYCSDGADSDVDVVRVWRVSLPREPHPHSVRRYAAGQRTLANQQNTQPGLGILLVPGRGFEPRFTASKAAVLPLDDPGMQEEVRR